MKTISLIFALYLFLAILGKSGSYLDAFYAVVTFCAIWGLGYYCAAIGDRHD